MIRTLSRRTVFPIWTARRRSFSSSSSRGPPLLQPTIHRRGDHPYGSREYLLCRPMPAAASKSQPSKVVTGHNGVPLQVMATLKANRHVVFGATRHVPDRNVAQLCAPLLHIALDDCQSVGEQPQALAALYGLCDYVRACLDHRDNGSDAASSSSPALQALDDAALAAVRAIATGIPREGHTVVGQGTHRDAAAGWEALAKEYAATPQAEECQLYVHAPGGQLVGVELLADTQPAYLASAGGAMVRYFFIS